MVRRLSIAMWIYLEAPFLPVHVKSLTVPDLAEMVTLVVKLEGVIHVLRINFIAESM